MAALYELVRTWIGLYVVGRKSCLLTVVVLIAREATRRLTMGSAED